MDDDQALQAETVERLQRAAQQPEPTWSDPSTAVWSQVAAQISSGTEREPASDADTLPKDSADPPDSPVSESAKGFTRRLVISGVGGLVVGAVLGFVGAVTWNDAQKPSGTIIGQADLTPLDEPGRVLGHAELLKDRAGTKLVVSVPEGIGKVDGFVEVWLINVDLQRMISVGVFAGGDTVWFRIDDSFIEAGYTIVDLSREKFDNDPRHSGDTLMRGPLVL